MEHHDQWVFSGYLRKGQPVKCIKMFDEMKVLGLKLDQVTISNVIGAFFFLRLGV